MVEEIAYRAGDELNGTLWQDAGFDDAADDEFGEIGRLACGLHDGGYAGDEGGGDFFQHAPDGEVEGVDMDRDAFKRGEDVLGGEGIVLRQSLHITVGQNTGVRQLAPCLRCVGEQGPHTALDVDPAVGTGGTGGEAFGVELLLELHQMLAESLQHRGALVEGHLSELWADDLATVGERPGEVDAGRVDLSDGDAGGGV